MTEAMFLKHNAEVFDDLVNALICNDVTFIQIYGWCYVGKTQLIRLALKNVEKTSSVEIQFFGCKPEPKHQFNVEELLNSKDKKIVVFDDFHNLLKSSDDNPFSLIDQVRSCNQNVTVVVIFRGLVPLSYFGRDGKSFQMFLLDKSKAKELFDSKFSSSETSVYKREIDTLLHSCSGFPMLVTKVAKELSGFSCPLAIREYFQQFNFPSEYFKCFEEIFKTTPESFRLLLSTLSHLPDWFHRFEYKYLKYFRDRTETHQSFDLIKKSRLLVENEDGTFSLLPIIRYFFPRCELYHIKSECLALLNIICMTGEILISAESYYQNPQLQHTNAEADHARNIQLLLRKVIHCKPGDCLIFKHLYEIADKAGKVVSLNPRVAHPFYQSCYDMSLLFGTEHEQTLLQFRIGQSLTKYSVHRNLVEGEKLCKSALVTFKKLKLNFRYLQVCNTLGLISYWRGMYQDGCRYCIIAINTKVDDRSQKEVKIAKIFCKNILAYTYMSLGLMEKGITLSDELLNDPDVENHPTLGIIISTLAWSNFLEGDLEQALELYQMALWKLKENSHEKNRWIVPMCYIADISSDLHSNHESALKLICQAENIQKEFCDKHVNFARIHLITAKINFRLGNLQTGKHSLETASKVMQQIDSNHHIFVEILIWLAHCNLINGDNMSAEKMFNEALEKLNTKGPPTHRSCETSVMGHLEELGSVTPKPHFFVDNCKFCMDIKKHNNQVSSTPENEPCPSQRMLTRTSPRREPVESLDMGHYPQQESGSR